MALTFSSAYALDARTDGAVEFEFLLRLAGASAADLTVGAFPGSAGPRHRVFYAFGTALGGIAYLVLFGALIQSGARINIVWGYLLGAVLMLAGGGGSAHRHRRRRPRPGRRRRAPIESLTQ